MKTLTKITLSIMALTLFMSFGHAQTSSSGGAGSQAAVSGDTKVDPAKEAEIRKYLRLIGATKMMNQMVDQMIATLSARDPSVSQEY